MERILFVTGASGAGKTSLVTALAARGLPGVVCRHFDEYGVPDPTPDDWQRKTTFEWIERLRLDPTRRLGVLDGQVRPTEALAAARFAGVSAAALLVDCSHEVRNARLRGVRAQPELATERMACWAAYLRGQADALQLPIIDTSTLGLEQATEVLARHVRVLLG